MVLERLGVHDDVVDVDVGVVNHVGKRHVHGPLEGSRGVSEAKRHNYPFKRPVASLKGGLRFISLSDSDLVETAGKVHFREILPGSEFVEHLVDPGQRVLVFSGQLVECSLVDDHSAGLIILVSEHRTRSKRARRGSDSPGCHEFFHLPLDLLLIGCRHSVQSVGRGSLCLVDHNRVIRGSGLREAFGELGKYIGEFFQKTGDGFWWWLFDNGESALSVVNFLAWA